MTAIERDYALLQSESSDQKGILEQYETRFIEVKRHIEKNNSEHTVQLEAYSRANEDLKKQVQKCDEYIKQIEEDKLGLQTKSRDLEWQKDQDLKAMQKQLEKAREE